MEGKAFRLYLAASASYAHPCCSQSRDCDVKLSRRSATSRLNNVFRETFADYLQKSKAAVLGARIVAQIIIPFTRDKAVEQ